MEPFVLSTRPAVTNMTGVVVDPHSAVLNPNTHYINRIAITQLLGPGCQSTKSFMPSGSCLPPRKCRDLNRFQFTAQSIGTSIISLVNQSIDDNPNNNNNNNRPQSAAKVQFTLDAGALEVGASESGYLQMTLKRLDKRLDDGRWIGSGTRLSSISYLHYGRVSARLRMAAGAGVVTSFIIMSDGRDEIDFEWVGKDLTSVQTNYFYRGIIDYSRGRVHEIEGGDLSRDYHDYTIEWTPVYIRWLVDGRELRLVWRNSTLSDSAEYQFPSEPSRVQFGLWDGAAGAQGVRIFLSSSCNNCCTLTSSSYTHTHIYIHTIDSRMGR